MPPDCAGSTQTPHIGKYSALDLEVAYWWYLFSFQLNVLMVVQATAQVSLNNITKYKILIQNDFLQYYIIFFIKNYRYSTCSSTITE